MIYGKIDRYILIAILAAVLIALYFLFTNKKDTSDQNNLLIAMAEKLRVSNPNTSDVEEQLRQKIENKSQEHAAITEDQQDWINAVADKLCFGEKLTPDEEEINTKFTTQVQDALKGSKKILSTILNKFFTGAKDFDEYEKEFYEYYQENIDAIVNYRKSLDSIVKKISEGVTQFSDEELQFQANYPKQIEDRLAALKKANDNFSGANPPMAAGERLTKILNLFKDGIPKTVGELSDKYAAETGTKKHTGNMSQSIGTLVDEGKLMVVKAGKEKKVYHGPPEWFVNKKLKPEYLQKITS